MGTNKKLSSHLYPTTDIRNTSFWSKEKEKLQYIKATKRKKLINNR